MSNSGIGFIGLGQMGLGMANNLAKIAAPFYAYDAMPAATDRLMAMISSLPAQLAIWRRIVISYSYAFRLPKR